MISGSLVAKFETSVVTKPSQRSLHDIAEFAQTTAVSPIVDPRDQGSNTPIAHARQDIRGAIGTVALEDLGSKARTSQRALDGGDRVQEIQSRQRVVNVSRADPHDQGNAIGIGYEVALAAVLGSVGRVGACVDPPKTALIEALSTTVRDQSISPIRPRWFSSRRCNSGQIPSVVQSASRLQQVQPLPQPNSAGRSFQGIPDLSTKRIPARHFRLWTGGRPPLGLGPAMGKSGAISNQSSSVTNCEDMSNPLSLPRVTHRHSSPVT